MLQEGIINVRIGGGSCVGTAWIETKIQQQLPALQQATNFQWKWWVGAETWYQEEGWCEGDSVLRTKQIVGWYFSANNNKDNINLNIFEMDQVMRLQQEIETEVGKYNELHKKAQQLIQARNSLYEQESENSLVLK